MAVSRRVGGMIVGVVAAMAGLTAAAGADPPAVVLSPSLTAFTPVDTQLTQFHVTVSCPADPTYGAPCPVTVKLTWRAYTLRSTAQEGPVTSLATTSVTLAPGQSTTLALSVAPSALRDVTARRHVGAMVSASLYDNRNGNLAGQESYASPVRGLDRCPGPAYVPFTGGPVTVVDRSWNGTTSQVTRSPVTSGELGVGEEMVAGASPVRFTVLGVTYVVSPHATFDRTCGALSDYHKGQAAPTVMLDSGTVHVTGRPYGAQIWVGIGTPEGNLGSRSQERVDFTVARDTGRQISTMRVAVGKTTQVTPFDHPTRSPCTDGQALQVDRFGHIKRL